MSLNLGMPLEEFLERHWQRSPLLIRGGMPLPDPPLPAEDLAALACHEDVTARIVLERGGSHPWEVRYGPFDDGDFARLPQTHWSLLVQEVDRYVPRIGELLERFRFVPNWRIDDVMVSYAAPWGNVGPHVDRYDVFLIQLDGRRKWTIAREPADEVELVDQTELQILSGFSPDEEWVLEPGDALYLPPRVPHHGVALEPCMTASIGFRAPGRQELLGGFLEECVERADPRPCFEDRGRRAPDNPGEIEPDVVEQLRETIRDAIEDHGRFADWAGRFLTAPRRGSSEEGPPTDRLRAGVALRRRAVSQLAFLRLGDGRIRLFMGGESRELEGSLATAAELLCSRDRLTADRLTPWLDQPGFSELVDELCRRGCLEIDEGR